MSSGQSNLRFVQKCDIFSRICRSAQNRYTRLAELTILYMDRPGAMQEKNPMHCLSWYCRTLSNCWTDSWYMLICFNSSYYCKCFAMHCYQQLLTAEHAERTIVRSWSKYSQNFPTLKMSHLIKAQKRFGHQNQPNEGKSGQMESLYQPFPSY